MKIVLMEWNFNRKKESKLDDLLFFMLDSTNSLFTF